MAKNKKDKRENKREEEWEQYKNTQSEAKKDEKKEEVILMGAPLKKTESLPKEADFSKRLEEKKTTISKKEAKETPSEGVRIEFGKDLAHTTAKKEELPKIEKTEKEKTEPKATPVVPKEHVGLGKIFLIFIGLFVAYLIVGQILNMFGPTTISLISLWPLLLILIGLSLFKVKKKGLTHILGYLFVFIVFFASALMVFKGGDIITIHTTGVIEIEERGVDPFTKIIFDGRGTVRLTEGDREAVIITADESIIEEIDVTNEGETLKVGYGNVLWSLFLFEKTAFDVEIISREITSVDVAGIADVTIEDVVAENLDVTLSGEGSISFENLYAEELVSRLNGSGDITAEGTAVREFVVLSGTGSYDGTNLASNETAVRLSGVGDVTVLVEEKLDAKVTGKGNVVYVGSPELVGNTALEASVYSQEEMTTKMEASESLDSEMMESEEVSLEVEINEDEGEVEVVEAPESVEVVEEVEGEDVVDDPEAFLKSLGNVLD